MFILAFVNNRLSSMLSHHLVFYNLYTPLPNIGLCFFNHQLCVIGERKKRNSKVERLTNVITGCKRGDSVSQDEGYYHTFSHTHYYHGAAYS